MADIEENNTIFGKILSGEVSCDKVYEDSRVFAFQNIAPEAKVHVLLVPKKHIEWLRDAEDVDQKLLGYLLLKVKDVAKAAGIYESGYRIIINDGKDAHGEVPHLHIHILGGQSMGTGIVK